MSGFEPECACMFNRGLVSYESEGAKRCLLCLIMLQVPQPLGYIPIH